MEKYNIIKKKKYELKNLKYSIIKIENLLKETKKINIYKMEYELKKVKSSIVKIEYLLSKFKKINIYEHDKDCWYHKRFGFRSTKCLWPCEFNKRNEECEEILKYFKTNSVSSISPIKDSRRVKIVSNWQKLFNTTSPLPWIDCGAIRFYNEKTFLDYFHKKK